MVVRFAAFSFGAVTTLKTRLAVAPPGATVTSIAAPSGASARPAGPLIVPGVPVPPTVTEPTLRPCAASAASAWSTVSPTSGGTC